MVGGQGERRKRLCVKNNIKCESQSKAICKLVLVNYVTLGVKWIKKSVVSGHNTTCFVFCKRAGKQLINYAFVCTVEHIQSRTLSA